jgi:hypothetical protein
MLALCGWNSPSAARKAASATVDTVNDTPIACSKSSRDRFSARSLPLDEPWALRPQLIGVRQMENLTMYARSLAEALRLPA